MNKLFWFADRTYPKWPVFMQIIAKPVQKKACWYENVQEDIRKNIERAFEVLQIK